MKLITNKAALSKSITSIATSIAKLDEQIHKAACSALAMYKQDGNALQYLTSLAKATATYSVRAEDGDKKAVWDGRSVRGADLRAWIEHFAGVKWSVAANKGEGGYRASKSVNAVTRGNIDVQQAIDNPFYSWARDTSIKAKEWDGGINDVTALRDKARLLLNEGKTKSGKVVLPEDAATARAVASALVNSIDEFLKHYGEHTNPDNTIAIEGEVVQDAIKVASSQRKPAKVSKAS